MSTEMDPKKALAVVSDTEASEDDVYDALHVLRAAVSDIERLREIERTALEVALAAKVDPPAHRYLVPAGPFDVMRRRLEPLYRAIS